MWYCCQLDAYSALVAVVLMEGWCQSAWHLAAWVAPLFFGS